MEVQFKKYVESAMPELLNSKLLVGVSGGRDSMALLYLLVAIGCEIEVMHCNFGLRGEESDAEEKFVKEYCVNRNIPCQIQRFEKGNESVQEWARKVRYEWFKKEADKSNALILTAHHQDDNLETFFINLLRGAGLHGLSGIPSVNQNIRRPLLGFSRAEIDSYVSELNIPFMDDSSNSQTKYLRNSIRLEVLCKLEEIQPDIKSQLAKSMSHLNEADMVWKELAEELKAEANEQGKFKMPDSIIEIWAVRGYLLDEGLSASQIESLLNPKTLTGSAFIGDNHSFHKNRDVIIIAPIGIQESEEWEQTSQDIIKTPIGDFALTTTGVDNWVDLVKDSGKDVQYYDKDKIGQSFTIRSWREGDAIQPLGMKGSKKVSDLLIDRKISRLDKINYPCVTNGNEIIGVFGIEVNEKFKISEMTKEAYRIERIN